MTRGSAPVASGDAINLAGTPDFWLGTLCVQPSLRRVSAGVRQETVEPRVMQALIALVEAGATVVSRDALIARCWGGRIVGEDAITRCIAKLRMLAEVAEPPAFSIETIPRVGYLLKPALDIAPAPGAPMAVPPRGDAAQPEGDASGQAIASRAGRRRVPGWREAGIAAFAMVLVVAGTVLAWRSAFPVARAPAIAQSAPFSPPPQSVAVLAFANLSSDPAQDYLSDGLSEALIDLLSRVNELRVTARTSSFVFKGKTATIGEIARALNVGSIMEGSLRRQGTHLRIDVNLIDARTGFQLWSQSYDRSADDLLKLQDEIARSAAEALRAKLIDTDVEGLNQGGTTNPIAFDAYLHGEEHLRATIGHETSWPLREFIRTTALVEFRRATTLDPGFALAQSDLAVVLVMIAQASGLDATYRAMMAEAHQAADRAVAGAPGLGLTHAQRAMVLRNEVADMSATWAEAKTARALTPGNAIVEQTYALMAGAIGQRDEAVKAAQTAVDLDPLQIALWWSFGSVLECARQYDRAREAFQRSVSLLGHAPSGAADEFALLLLKQGDAQAARPLCEKIDNANGGLCLAIADHALGRQAAAENDLSMLRRITGDEVPIYYADVYAQWHQPASALAWLKKAREINDPELRELRCDQWLDPLRQEPDFRTIEDSLHFPP